MAKHTQYPGVRRYDGARGTTYQAMVRVAGFPTESRTFPTAKAAADWRADRERELRRGVATSADARSTTVAKAVDRYRREILPRLKSRHDREVHLQYLDDHIGRTALHKVTPDRLDRLRDQLATERSPAGGTRSPATVRRYLATWSHLFNVAVRDWRLIGTNPMVAVRKPSESPNRTRYLSADEERRLLDACRDSDNIFLLPAVVVALCSGARLGEIMRLRWGDVDLQAGLAWLDATETKNSAAKALHMAPAVPALERLKETTPFGNDDEPVFPRLGGTLSHDKRGRYPMPGHIRAAFNEAMAAAGVDHFRWHDLRHTAASRMLAAGVSLAVVGEVLGHRAAQTTKRYAHLSTDAAAAAVAAAWADRLL